MHRDSSPTILLSSPSRMTMSSPEKDSSSGFDTSTDSLLGYEKGRRRASKSFAERKRRAKINGCLYDLQRALYPSEKQMKEKKLMEKAEVLKLSIIELSRLRNQVTDLKTKLRTPMKEGYRACMKDTSAVIQNASYLSHDMKDLLLNDLTHALQLKESTQRAPLTQRNEPVNTLPYSTNSNRSQRQSAAAFSYYNEPEFSGVAKDDYVDPLLWRPW